MVWDWPAKGSTLSNREHIQAKVHLLLLVVIQHHILQAQVVMRQHTGLLHGQETLTDLSEVTGGPRPHTGPYRTYSPRTGKAEHGRCTLWSCRHLDQMGCYRLPLTLGPTAILRGQLPDGGRALLITAAASSSSSSFYYNHSGASAAMCLAESLTGQTIGPQRVAHRARVSSPS